jgi:hypothetical protein
MKPMANAVFTAARRFFAEFCSMMKVKFLATALCPADDGTLLGGHRQ